MLVLSPLFLAIAVAVFVTSRGPVFYRSIRPGIGGEPFACFKFRTMLTDADQMQADLESENEASGALFKIRADPRLTRVGAFLRRYSLDELPQLFNVIAGQMSLVGPRPLPQRDFDQLEDWHKKRYLVLPGVTGLWQVSGRAELDFDDLVRLDFLYLERWSIGLDLSILIKTIPAVTPAPRRLLVACWPRRPRCSPWRRRATTRTPVRRVDRAGGSAAGRARRPSGARTRGWRGRSVPRG